MLTDEQRAARAAGTLQPLANARRIRILAHLRGVDLSVNVLAGAVGLSQSALTQHLAVLRRDGLVKQRRAAQTIIYGPAADPHAWRILDLFGEEPPPVEVKAAAG